MVSVTGPYGRILGFLDRKRNFAEVKLIELARNKASCVLFSFLE
jgi:hypothetical protein